MNEQDKRHRIRRAQEVLRDIHHIPVATVNEDSSPHASPVLFVFDDRLHGFWASSLTALHSQNIARDPRVFLCIFDSRGGHSGLFLAGTAAALTDHQAIAQGHNRIRTLKKKLYGEGMADVAAYIGESTQRIYEFIPEQAWVNHSDRQDGVIIRDRRYEIAISELFVR